MQQSYSLVAAGMAGLSVLLVVNGLGRVKRRATVSQRLEQMLARRTAFEEDLRQPLADRLVRPLLGGLAGMVSRFAPAKALEKTKQRLQVADLGNGLDASTFMALRLLGATGFGLLLAFLALAGGAGLIKGILCALGAGALAFMLPVFWLGGKVRQRQDAIRVALPDMLDLLTLCIEAMPFDRAFARVAEQSPPALRQELGRVIHEMHLNTSRREALGHLAERVGLEELSTLVASISQAEQRGTPLARVLHDLAVDMRLRRRLRAETLAREAPIKMMFPLVLLVFPPLFIVILGPSVPQILHAVAPGLKL